MTTYIVTDSNYKRTLKTLVSNGTSGRDRLQALIVYGLKHVAEHDDASKLTEVMNAIIPVKVYRTQTAKDYIKAHVTNLTWTKLKDGKYGFAKFKKGVPCEVTIPSESNPWYEFNNVGNAKPDMDILTQMKALQTRVSKALNGESDKRIKEGQETLAVKMLQAFDALMKLAPQESAGTDKAKGKQQAKVLTANA